MPKLLNLFGTCWLDVLPIALPGDLVSLENEYSVRLWRACLR